MQGRVRRHSVAVVTPLEYDDEGVAEVLGQPPLPVDVRGRDAFRSLWARHDIRSHSTGGKHFHHPVVGDQRLTYQTLVLPDRPGLTLLAYYPEPGKPSQDALALLASWARTEGLDVETGHTTGDPLAARAGQRGTEPA